MSALDIRKTKYDLFARILHWTMAVLILHQFLKVAERLNDGENWLSAVLPKWHGSLGLILLALIVVRSAWAVIQIVRNRRPRSVSLEAKTVHLALYALMLAVPLSAVMLMVGKGYGLKFFGFELISKGPDISWMAELGALLHGPLALVLMLLAAGHIAVAFVDNRLLKSSAMKRII